MEASEPVAARSAAPTVGGTAVGNVRRRRRVWPAPQTTAQAALGGTAPQSARAQSVRAVVCGVRVRGLGHTGGRGGVGRLTVNVVSDSGCSGGRVYRRAVSRGGQRRAMELSDHGCSHRAERVVRARVSHVNDVITVITTCYILL